ncbi:MAG: DUF6504 family protein [bacterium]|nr:DUF6504 family protein [bacterium]
MSEEFVGNPIIVTYNSDKLKPTSFTWKDREYKITEIIDSYQDFKFSPTAPNKKNWKLRRHRNYWVVKTDDGTKFKIYLDRAGRKREWILFSKYV